MYICQRKQETTKPLQRIKTKLKAHNITIKGLSERANWRGAQVRQTFVFGAIAQMVEHRTENPSVGGSIPPRTTKTDKTMKTDKKTILQMNLIKAEQRLAKGDKNAQISVDHFKRELEKVSKK